MSQSSYITDLKIANPYGTLSLSDFDAHAHHWQQTILKHPFNHKVCSAGKRYAFHKSTVWHCFLAISLSTLCVRGHCRATFKEERWILLSRGRTPSRHVTATRLFHTIPPFRFALPCRKNPSRPQFILIPSAPDTHQLLLHSINTHLDTDNVVVLDHRGKKQEIRVLSTTVSISLRGEYMM